MWEIFTYGGGEFLVQIFNAVAAISSSNNYVSLIKISVTGGLIWVLFVASFEMRYAQGIQWFIAFMVIYNIMFIPKITIHITDRLNPSIQGSTIDNIPIGLGAVAALSSQIGDSITKMMEQNFSMPDDMKYQKNGLVFGAKLLRQIGNVRISNSSFASNMSSYIKQCVFYDLLLGKYTLDNLKKTNDLWHFITVENTPSPARALLYKSMIDPKSSDIITCSEATSRFNSVWGQEINSSYKILADKIFSSQNQIFNNQTIITMLPISYDYFFKISADSTNIMQQNIMINIFKDSATDFTAKGITDAYAAAKVEIQAEKSYQAIARQAEKWLPTLKIIFECLYYGSFPIIFLLMLLPNYKTILKSYFFSFIWLQSFAPLYAILNLIMNGVAKNNNLSASQLSNGTQAITLLTQNGILQVNHDISVMAGYLSMSIPFIALGIAKGSLNIANLATSMLNVPQSAAGTVAAEAVSGNINLGNVNLDSKSSNNVSQNRITSSPYIDDNAFSFRNEEGGFTTNYNNKIAYDQHQAFSNVANFDLNVSKNIEKNIQHSINYYKELSNDQSKSAENLRSSSYSKIIDNIQNQSKSEQNSDNYSQNTSQNLQKSVQIINSSIKETAKYFSIDETQAKNLIARISGGASLNLGNFFQIGAQISAEKNSRVANSLTNSLQDKERLTVSISNAYNEITSFNHSKNYVISNQKGENITSQIQADLAQAQKYETSSRNALRQAKIFSQTQTELTSNSLNINFNHKQDFLTNWLTKQDDYERQNTDGSYQKITNQRALEIVSDIDKQPLLKKYIAKYSNEITHKMNLEQINLKDNSADSFKITNPEQEKLDQEFLQNKDKITEQFQKTKTIDNSYLQNNNFANLPRRIQAKNLEKKDWDN